MGPSPAVSEIRNAVRECLGGMAPGAFVLAACSGGADSLALAAAVAFAAPRAGVRAGGITVDHGLQPGSARRAAGVAAVLKELGLDPVECVTVAVREGGGPEAAARAARYAALGAAARGAGAAAVLLGHTLDDQAETVLLGLARGSGGRSRAGMPASDGLYRRPLLSVRRATTRAACAALGLQVWDDPHNADPRYTRARVRHQAMPALEAALGPGVAEALARTAAMLRADAEYLDELAELAAMGVRDDSGMLSARALAGMPQAIRTRVLRGAAVAAGCPPGSLTACHVRQLENLVNRWHGQRWIDLPGGVRALRRDGGLRLGCGAVSAGSQQETSHDAEGTEGSRGRE